MESLFCLSKKNFIDYTPKNVVVINKKKALIKLMNYSFSLHIPQEEEEHIDFIFFFFFGWDDEHFLSMNTFTHEREFCFRCSKA